MMEITTEQPQYTLNQSMARAILPKLFSLLVLSLIFYGGVLLNLELLSLSLDQESLIKVISIAVLSFLVLLGLLFSWRQAKTSYLFFSNRITFKEKVIFYKAINLPSVNQNLLDKLFRTYSLNLGSGFVLRHISQEHQVEGYLRQMMQYN